ncbi:DUF1800 domain-containing protein [Sediminibacterium soli]|uniref:DUF1800 domain-containing protein n=1 Tax=Sediminibacterium soli TaxID=2698829 RepID=UPI001379EB28|nr:DUF1800 domain-containing protein [Sediminibacterium soli]NCI45438.1 DUF1800 domain-containing protein [Sediminibacterium soli]
MNRRDFLPPILTAKEPEPGLPSPSPPPNGGLTQYSGAWTENETIHLLKRTLFGATRSDIDYFRSRGFLAAVDEILNPTAPLPAPPVKEYTSVTDAAIIGGNTWVNDTNSDGTLNSQRRASFKKWWMGVMLRQDRSIREKITLFWHNHWATESSVIGNAQYVYNHHNLLRTMSLGNFRQMARAITTDPAMLVYQNGQLNTRQAPDENYGRELQELFCVGKGPGSQYTEDDVKAAARVLTGWRIDPATGTAFFTEARHDTGSKTFSSFYNNTVIQGKTGPTGGDEEINALLDMIFSTQEVARYICRRIYRWFVYYDIDAMVEANIITPLANLFRNSNYEIKPVLDTLLKSEHFFDVLAKGCQIKSPVDLVVSMCREFNVTFPPAADYLSSYGMYAYLVNQVTVMQQNIGDPPDVSGWKAYYQAPQYYEIWINSDTLPKRNQFTDTMAANGYTYNGHRINIEGAEFAKTLSNPGDPNKLIDDILTILYRIDISAASKTQLKTDILLGGQSSDYYWTGAWNTYITNPGDMANTTTVKNRLRDLLKYFMDLAEYQLA